MSPRQLRPQKKTAKKVPPPRKLTLEEQTITQAMLARMKEKAFAATRRVLQVANSTLKRKKVRSALELLKKQ